MTVTRKTSYKECEAILADPNSSEYDKKSASERMDSIKAWLKKKDYEQPTQTKQDSGRIKKELLNLPDEVLDGIKKDTEQMLQPQLARIFFIEEGLRERGITPTGPFVGMLYNQQMESLRAAP
jgi:hypothetical protein